MPGPLELQAFLPTGHPALEEHSRKLRALIGEVAALSASRLVTESIAVQSNEERAAAKEAGLQERNLEHLTHERWRQGFAGLVLRRLGKRRIVESLDSPNLHDAPYALAVALATLDRETDGIKRTFAIVTGKQELRLDDRNLVPQDSARTMPVSVRSVLEQAFPHYGFETVALAGGSVAIADRHRGVFITQPGVPYTAAELRRLDDFLLQGGRTLVVFASATRLSLQNGVTSLSATGLEPLLEAYGIEARIDTLVDPGIPYRVPVRTQSGELQELRLPTILDVEAHDAATRGMLDASFPPFWRVDELAFPLPSSLRLRRDRQPPDVMLRAVTRTTAVAYRTDQVHLVPQIGPTPRPRATTAEDSSGAQQIIAAVVEGRLVSAFRHGTRSPAPSRLLVVASGLYVTNPFAALGNATGNADLKLIAGAYARKYLTNTILSVKNTMDWIFDADELAACEPGRAWRRR
jgi:hypothetical protein